MSDFVTTANAAIAKLQEIEQVVGQSKAYISSGEVQLAISRGDAQAHVTEVLELIGGLQQRVDEARAERQTQINLLSEQVDSISGEAAEWHQIMEGSFEELNEQVQLVIEIIKEGEDLVEELGDQVVEKLDDVKQQLETSDSRLGQAFDKLEQVIEESKASLTEALEGIREKDEDCEEHLTEICETRLRKQGEQATEQLERLRQEASQAFSSVQEKVHDAAEKIVSDAKSQIEDLLEKLGDATTEVCNALETLGNTSSQVASGIDVVNDCSNLMNQSAVGLELAIAVLHNLREILRKIT